MSQVRRDPLLGNIFENLVVLEALKARYNQGLAANLYYFRDSAGHEIDLLFKSGRELNGIEIKAGSTWSRSFKKGLVHFAEKISPLAHSYVIYSGEALAFSDGLQVLPFSQVNEVFASV